MISLEAVPRSSAALESAARTALRFPGITHINVPDLNRFQIRSWEGCSVISSIPCIPHLRAMYFDPDEPFPHRELFRRLGIRTALVIAGDPPTNAGIRTWPQSAVSFIKKLKAEMPELELYAAFDPYRSNIRYELDYLAEKEEAGAAGFMSQPFFDLRLLEIYAEYLEGKNVFWGVAPVLSPGNRAYWESRNRAIFPKHFQASLDWNVDFARRVLDFCGRQSFSLYLMPIKVDLNSYLSGLFSPS